MDGLDECRGLLFSFFNSGEASFNPRRYFFFGSDEYHKAIFVVEVFNSMKIIRVFGIC